LGILIRKVTGKYYGDFLQERVFKPLGMTTARVISEEDIIPNRASGYRLVNGELKNQEWVSPSTNSTADGSLYLSILDMAKWDGALYTDTPLTQASRNRIWTPAQLSDGTTKGYGFGWHILDLHGHRTYRSRRRVAGFQDTHSSVHGYEVDESSFLRIHGRRETSNSLAHSEQVFIRRLHCLK
jgi:CubicO group peptidase (beta-lactamase class C family)